MEVGLKIKYLQVELLDWYSKNRRNFPWREKESSHYNKIISEVLLQRTKAERVAKFYPSFIRKYPSWLILSMASQDELEIDLTALGLHRQRAKRLYSLAQEMGKRNGVFPTSREVIEDFPLFGQYIANAFEIFILRNPKPLLDVNMARFLERQFEPRRKVDMRFDLFLQELAHAIVHHPKIEEINWAILDFAALICTARTPKCEKCPVSGVCNYFSSNLY